MKNLFPVLALAGLMGLGGCETFNSAAASQTVETVQIKATNLVQAAAEAQSTVAHALTYSANNGFITGQDALTAKAYLNQSLDVIHQADKDVALGKDVMTELSQAYGLIGKASGLIKTKKGAS